MIIQLTIRLIFTGPFKLNRVPLRRINQSYVMATKTKVDISNVDIPQEIDDSYFKRALLKEKQKKGSEIFQDGDKVSDLVDWLS